MADVVRVREGLRLHRREGERFVADLEALTPEQWNLPTNCPPWLVRTLAAHVARQVESYTGYIKPGLRGERAEPESREARTNRMNEIAAWETPQIVRMLRETNEEFNQFFDGLTPAQLDVEGPHSHGMRSASWFVDMRLAEMAFHRLDLEHSLGQQAADLDPETARHLLPMLLELNVPAVVNRDKTGGEGTYVLAVADDPSAVWQLAFRPGSLRVTPGVADGDVRFTSDPAALAKLVYGRATWPALEQAGRLTVSGDRTAAERFHACFKGP
ncbi:MAG: maleylpyruvate isomerase family mycothiol-dependent enzyme [Chloroflexi bacterium]|nr:maleylpyruvate isomerase family mycothiol-dependent enzyme [Chloroflexota bacterium]